MAGVFLSLVSWAILLLVRIRCTLVMPQSLRVLKTAAAHAAALAVVVSAPPVAQQIFPGCEHAAARGALVADDICKEDKKQRDEQGQR